MTGEESLRAITAGVDLHGICLYRSSTSPRMWNRTAMATDGGACSFQKSAIMPDAGLLASNP